MSDFNIRPVGPGDRDWVADFITQRWGAEFIAAHYEVYHCKDLPGFLALKDEDRIGLLTYTISGTDCEVVSLDSVSSRMGVGTALMDAVKKAAVEAGCKRLWLVTTNDNMNALRFYQKRGFVLVKINRNSLEFARGLKPVPLVGNDGIPLRDEIELEMILDRDVE